MPSTENTASADANSVQALLAAMKVNWDDLDERGRQQAAVLAFGRLANAQTGLLVLMQNGAALVAEMLEAELSSVAQVSPDGARLIVTIDTHGARAGAGQAAVHESPLDAESSLAGYALNRAGPVITRDLKADTRFDDLPLRKLGVHTAMAVPLRVNAEPFGAIGVYRRNNRVFTTDDIQFAEMIAHFLVSAIARAKAEAALQQQLAFSSRVLGMVDAVLIVLDGRGNLLSLNRACERITGFTTAEVRGRSFCSVFTLQQEVDLIQSTLRHARETAEGTFESQLVCKDGTRRRVAWSWQAMCNGAKSVQSIVLSGLDRTELVETLAQSERASTAAEESARALRQLRQRVYDEGLSLDPAVAADGASARSRARQRDDSRQQPFQETSQFTGAQLRRSPRRSYQYPQLIAPMFEGVMPAAEQFVEVVCEDISAGGIAFYLEQPPEFHDLVAALGKPPAVVYFGAHVVRVVPKELNGKKAYLIGCRFTGRVDGNSENPAQ